MRQRGAEWDEAPTPAISSDSAASSEEGSEPRNVRMISGEDIAGRILEEALQNAVVPYGTQFGENRGDVTPRADAQGEVTMREAFTTETVASEEVYELNPTPTYYTQEEDQATGSNHQWEPTNTPLRALEQMREAYLMRKPPPNIRNRFLFLDGRAEGPGVSYFRGVSYSWVSCQNRRFST